MAERESRPLAWLGIETVKAGRGEAALEMEGRPDFADGDRIHRGFLAVLAQSALEAAIAADAVPGQAASGFDLQCNFTGVARAGERLRAVARVIHSGRRTALAECTITGPQGRLIGTATATFQPAEADG
ncbi:MAG: PaaI family thioesterase [Candidatus Dormibacteraeota bacterium]|nr:PaaI family thioesterase [Candidatus Dormibacteraeota bacterium]